MDAKFINGSVQIEGNTLTIKGVNRFVPTITTTVAAVDSVEHKVKTMLGPGLVTIRTKTGEHALQYGSRQKAQAQDLVDYLTQQISDRV